MNEKMSVIDVIGEEIEINNVNLYGFVSVLSGNGR